MVNSLQSEPIRDLLGRADYLAYVRNPANSYLSIQFPESDGLEITCRA